MPYALPSAGRRGREHPGVAAERGLHDGGREGLADLALLEVLDGDPQVALRGGGRGRILGGDVLERHVQGADVEAAGAGEVARARGGATVGRIAQRLGQPDAGDHAQRQIGLGARRRGPVSTRDIVLRNPANRLTATFSFSGAGAPRTPLIGTRSGPAGVSAIVSNSAVTSGLAYCGPAIS